MVKTNLLGDKVASFVLCEGRHEIPEKDALFPTVVPVLAFGKLELLAMEKLKPLADDGCSKLIIYATGCVSAMIAALNVATQLSFREVSVMHFDAVSQGYQEQKVKTLADVY